MWKAVIFDMDGILVNSEPYWRQAMVKIFCSAGITFTEEDCRLTTGKRIDEVVKFWSTKRPFKNKTAKAVEEEIVEELCSLLIQYPVAMPGVQEALNICTSNGLATGLATSSSVKIIDCVLTKLNLQNRFNAVLSAEHLPFGKPHPLVFLRCAEQLNVKPEECIVVEDSVNGVIAGKAAGMFTVAIPESVNFQDARFSIADRKLKNLLELAELLTQNYREISLTAH